VAKEILRGDIRRYSCQLQLKQQAKGPPDPTLFYTAQSHLSEQATIKKTISSKANILLEAKQASSVSTENEAGLYATILDKLESL